MIMSELSDMLDEHWEKRASVEKVAAVYALAYEDIEKEAGIAAIGKAIGSGAATEEARGRRLRDY